MDSASVLELIEDSSCIMGRLGRKLSHIKAKTMPISTIANKLTNHHFALVAPVLS